MPDARKECYDRLIDYMYLELRLFYVANPDLLKDGGSIYGIAAERDRMAGMLKILDEYEITKKVLG